ncbi:General aromatic amino acid permease [Dermatophilus congolensis]|uniref:General aromatic amino acid permease n=1 Tax=Dermatophilus congolensis TaxID=1863 RepID=A0AA46BLF0_9MICO|nr:amino acid permease [Dermatophilus congolensis]STD04153.1 General aromatic amino acid permease [Dermatophilus congolensis]
MSHSHQDRLHSEQIGYQQTLGRRHVQMIALGGAIGTGLFLGSASRLHSTGPALLFSYAFVGIVAYFLMRSLGELVLHRATSGAFVSYMREFFGEKWAFITGWIYWLHWCLTGIAELSAVALYIKHWWPNVPAWLTVIISLAVVLIINLLSARAFGEFEFWASLLKVAAIVLFLVVGVVMVLFQLRIGDHQAGISNLWSNPGGFWPTEAPYNWYGPILVMSGVVFAYASIEMVGIAAGEMQNPEREVPKAVNAVIMRIAVFYCGSILLLASMLPTSQYTAGTSPFVTIFDTMGFHWMGSAIQAVLIIAAMSSLNSGLYTTGRVLRSMGMASQAPFFTTRMSRAGVPWAGILLTSAVLLMGAVLNALAPDAFEIALECSAICELFVWGTIFACQLRLRQLVNKGVIPAGPFQAPGYPWASWFGLAFLVFVIIGMSISGWKSSPDFWHKTDFVVVIIGIPVLALIIALGWRIVRPAVEKNTGGRLAAVWSDTGLTYPDTNPDVADVLASGTTNNVTKPDTNAGN